MQTETEHTVLDDLNLIERIENETPWNDADLAELLIPWLRENRDIEKIKVQTLRAQPGVKRENQQLLKASMDTWSRNPDPEITLSLISPKRASARTDLLDRLSLAGDIKSSESHMPLQIVSKITHVLTKSRKRGEWKCSRGECNCTLPPSDVILRGCTKTRTQPRISLERLEQQLHWAEQYVENAREKLEKEIKKRDRLIKRVEKRRADQA